MRRGSASGRSATSRTRTSPSAAARIGGDGGCCIATAAHALSASHGHQPTATRYAVVGELVHLDIKKLGRFWHVGKSGRRVSNPRPLAWEANALPTELRPPGTWILPPGVSRRQRQPGRSTSSTTGSGRNLAVDDREAGAHRVLVHRPARMHLGQRLARPPPGRRAWPRRRSRRRGRSCPPCGRGRRPGASPPRRPPASGSARPSPPGRRSPRSSAAPAPAARRGRRPGRGSRRRTSRGAAPEWSARSTAAVSPTMSAAASRQSAAQVVRAATLEGGHRLVHLERVSDRPAERLVHGREHAGGRHPLRPAQPHHRLGQILRRAQVGHERPLPHLDVEQQPRRPGGELLGHDAGRDQRDRRHRRGHVAERVQPLVGRAPRPPSERPPQRRSASPARPAPAPRARPGSRGSTPACRASRRCARARGRRAWPPAPRSAATSGATTSVVLSPTPPVECLSATGLPTPVRSIRAPESTIASRSAVVSASVIPREHHRHQERRQLVVGHLRRDHRPDLVRRQLTPVALAGDQVDDARAAHPLTYGWPSAAGARERPTRPTSAISVST